MKTTSWQTKALTLFIAAAALSLTTACTNAGPTNAVPPASKNTEIPSRELTETQTRQATEATNALTEEATQARARELTGTPTRDVQKTPSVILTKVTTEVPTQEAIKVPTREVTEVPTPEVSETPTAVVPTTIASPTPTTPDPAPVTSPEPTPTPSPTGSRRNEQGECTTESPQLTSRSNISEEEYQELMHRMLLASSVLHEYEVLFCRQPNVYDVSDGFFRDGKGGWTDTWGITVWVTEKVDQRTLAAEDRIPDSIENVPLQIVDEEPLPSATETGCDWSMCGPKDQNTTARRREVRLKYDPLFWRQPYVHGVSEGRLRDGRGGWFETLGINVVVARKVDQKMLPPEDRIPECLEGIPVNITEQPGRIKAAGVPMSQHWTLVGVVAVWAV